MSLNWCALPWGKLFLHSYHSLHVLLPHTLCRDLLPLCLCSSCLGNHAVQMLWVLFLYYKETQSHSKYIDLPTLTIFPHPLLQCYLNLRCRSCSKNVSIRTGLHNFSLMMLTFLMVIFFSPAMVIIFLLFFYLQQHTSSIKVHRVPTTVDYILRHVSLWGILIQMTSPIWKIYLTFILIYLGFQSICNHFIILLSHLLITHSLLFMQAQEILSFTIGSVQCLAMCLIHNNFS